MKLFRYMSREEFRKYINGETLINTKDHHEEGNFKTNSVGFCFFNYAHYEPEKIFHSVAGIVNPISICCIFETGRKNVRKTWGRYATNLTMNDTGSFIADEYCTTQYSKEKFKLIKFAITDWFNLNKWNWREL